MNNIAISELSDSSLDDVCGGAGEPWYVRAVKVIGGLFAGGGGGDTNISVQVVSGEHNNVSNGVPVKPAPRPAPAKKPPAK
jgi:hypothetical protein